MDFKEPLIEVKNLKVYFPVEKGIGFSLFSAKQEWIRAVDNISFCVYKGETLGLVGESGCGKTTTGRAIIGLTPLTDGQIIFQRENITNSLKQGKNNSLYKNMQFIFQDSAASLNPRMKIGTIIGRTLINYKIVETPGEKRKVIKELLHAVGLQAYHADRYPHEFSGGQKQRIAIARALAAKPKFIVADEPVSSLDVSVQAQIINLLLDLKERFSLTILFITHDLSVAQYLSDRIAVMYLGKIMEIGCTHELFQNPKHPYTQALLSSIPEPNPKASKPKTKITLRGKVPSAIKAISGCRLHPRCPFRESICCEEEPVLTQITDTHYVACHLVKTVNTNYSKIYDSSSRNSEPA